jgi:multicomponent Na+:H+ antiporter subunit F
MTLASAELVAWAMPGIIAIMGLATLVAAVRLFLGPSLPDRVVALDLVGTLAVGSTAIYAILENEPVYLTVAVVLALLLFVGTVAFAHYLGRQREDEERAAEDAKRRERP